MFKSMIKIAISVFTFIFISYFHFVEAGCCGGCFGDCNQMVDIGIGWRRDSLNWKLEDIHTSCINARVDSHLDFHKIDMYTAHARTKWVGEAFYIRLSAEYGWTEKGRKDEFFKINTPILEKRCVSVHTDNPVKRRSEVYDFTGAIGYPFVFFCHRLNVYPLIGFSYHRQRLRTKDKDHSSCQSFVVRSSDYFDDSYLSSTDCLCFDTSLSSLSTCSFESSLYNPFSCSSSDPNIASALGLIPLHRTSGYRFTWYGFFLGVDLAYALDPCWTIYTELEWHLLDNCHRKRDSKTGVDFVDNYHHKGWANGFNGSLGVLWVLGSCWYANAVVDFKWWHADAHHDKLTWKSVGTNIGLSYLF